MLKSVEGIYRDGKVELRERPGEVLDDTPVIVTFLKPGCVDLRERGIDAGQAAELHARLGTFAEEWESPEMKAYGDYDTAKARL